MSYHPINSNQQPYWARRGWEPARLTIRWLARQYGKPAPGMTLSPRGYLRNQRQRRAARLSRRINRQNRR